MVYFVATPIGNLSEMTFRAVEVLNSVHAIFCEDTRHSQVLLNHYNISKPVYSYHKFNEKASLDFALSKAIEGDIAVISDAGMPAISDPGNILVNALKQQNLPYTVISGASAFVNAFVMSGFQPPFTFVGFLPEKTRDRQQLFSEINTNGVLIFYLSVHNLEKDFEYLHQQLGERTCCLVKELSKLHEQAVFCNLSHCPSFNKGEFVLVVDRATKNALCELQILEHVKHYMDKCGLTKNDAIKQTAKDRGLTKNEVYQLMLSD